MRRLTLIVTSTALCALIGTGGASAETVSVGGASAASVGRWVKPTGCSQFPVQYSGLPVAASTTIHVLDAVTRTDLGSAFVTSSEPRSGRVNIQICSFQVEDTTKILLSLDVAGYGVADSTVFGWSPRPNTVRCVNKRTYAIREFPGKKCPPGWVER